MNKPSCRTTFPTGTLIAYWLAEPDDAAAAEFEEHLFACAECGERLGRLVQLSEGIRKATRDGNLHAVLTPAFVRRLRESGLSVREYRLEPGGSVACTVTPDDDLVVAHLRVPLHDVQQLDMVVHDLTAGTRHRLQDVAFDPAANEIVLAPNVTELRLLTVVTQRVELFAVQGAGEHVIGEYTFNHSASGPAG
ncbi:MAG TPA: hypothetical protein VKB34_21595 [Povalibacter sp.]|nr:hypothetical protein [Povalibacter sp.]